MFIEFGRISFFYTNFFFFYMKRNKIETVWQQANLDGAYTNIFRF